jgi:hypothetical protein
MCSELLPHLIMYYEWPSCTKLCGHNKKETHREERPLHVASVIVKWNWALCFLKDLHGHLKYIYYSFDFQKKLFRVYWNLWLAHPIHQPSTWNGNRPWQRSLQKFCILPFDSMNWRSGQTSYERVTNLYWASLFKAPPTSAGWGERVRCCSFPRETENGEYLHSMW